METTQDNSRNLNAANNQSATPKGERPGDYTSNDQAAQQGANTGEWQDERKEENLGHADDGQNENDNTGGAGSTGSAATNS